MYETTEKFIEQYPTAYERLRTSYREFEYGGGWSMLGSYSYSDLADWLSSAAGVKYSIARKFVELFIE